jgi:transcriptional regulator with XRE-family HTH domain
MQGKLPPSHCLWKATRHAVWLHTIGSYTYLDCVHATMEPQTPLDLRVLAATSRRRPTGVAKVPAKIVPPVDTPVDFKDWLIARMDAMGLSIAELARRSGANGSSITNLRSGEAKPGLDILRKLARGLDMPLPEILVIAGRIGADEWEGPASEPLYPVEQEIRARLRSKSPLNERQKQRLIGLLVADVELFDDVYAEVLAIMAEREGRR